MLAYYQTLSVLLFTFFLNINCLALEKSDNLSELDWESKCENFKHHYLTNPQLNITFSNTPDVENPSPYWLLHWNNIEIPLPKTHYQDIYVSINKGNNYELILTTPGNLVISLLTFGNDPINDIFATPQAGSDNITSSQQGILATETMFGGPASLAGITLIGFKMAPKDLSCKNKNRIHDSAKLMALTLKKTAASNKLISVHKLEDNYQGWIEKNQQGVHLKYAVNIISNKSHTPIYQISYIIPKNLSYHKIPFLIGNKHLKINSNISMPTWLNALNQALKENSTPLWKNYLAVAQTEGISKKSIQRTSKNLKITTQP